MYEFGSRRGLLLGLSFMLLLTAALVYRHQFGRAAKNQRSTTADYGLRIIKYTEEGRYDDAIRTGLEALRNDPTDAGVYDQIAVVYLIRADKDAARRETWVGEAVVYADKALTADPDNPVSLYGLAAVLDAAGDLSAKRRCTCYQRAGQLADRAALLLQADHIKTGGKTYPIDPVQKSFTAYGHTFKIEPLQKEIQLAQGRLNAKITKNQCK